jgi:hypothetical protein
MTWPWPVSGAVRQLRRGIAHTWRRWAVPNNPDIHYGQIRPIRGRPFVVPLKTDCSGLATLITKWNGGPDPNGRNYDGEGYTGTMLAHLPHIPKWQARRGDLAVFGGGTGRHVVVFLQAGIHPDPLVGSHGWEGEPAILRLSAVAAGFPRAPVTYLRLVPGRWRP